MLSHFWRDLGGFGVRRRVCYIDVEMINALTFDFNGGLFFHWSESEGSFYRLYMLSCVFIHQMMLLTLSDTFHIYFGYNLSYSLHLN